MSGDEGARRPAEPMDVTDEEVEQLAGRRTKPVAAVKRMRKLVPAEPTGRLTTDGAIPARINREELTSMRRAGSSPDKLIGRLAASADSTKTDIERHDEGLEGPTKRPPVDGR